MWKQIILWSAIIMLVSAPGRFYQAASGIDVVIHTVGGTLDLLIGLALIYVYRKVRAL